MNDHRTIRCKGLLRGDAICKSRFSILSQNHLDEEISRLRTYNGVLDGPACGCCGTRFLAHPDEFTMKGAHQRTKHSKGKPIGNNGMPKAVRVLLRPCKGKKGARITISLPHEKQKTTKDNLRIRNAFLNSTDILDVQWMLAPPRPAGRLASAGSMTASNSSCRCSWHMSARCCAGGRTRPRKVGSR